MNSFKEWVKEMPCGGVFPTNKIEERCFFCNRKGAKHFFEEWDAFIHAKCFFEEVRKGNEECWIAINHGHEFVLDLSIEQPEGVTK
jgi:hypothetical protein